MELEARQLDVQLARRRTVLAVTQVTRNANHVILASFWTGQREHAANRVVFLSSFWTTPLSLQQQMVHA